MSVADQKRSFNKLKHDLESWRGVIVTIHSILKWEKKYYPGVVFSVTSLIFLILWLLDLSTLTLISLGALSCVLFDYCYPFVALFLFNPKNWSGIHEIKFEEACTEIHSLMMRLTGWYEYLFTVKEKKSTMFMIAITIVLLLCAWIGIVIDNLFLTYLLTMVVVLYPGLKHHGVIEIVKSQFGGLLCSKIQEIKEKAVPSKAE